LPKHLGLVVDPGLAPPVGGINGVGLGASGQSVTVVGVDLERPVEQAPSLLTLSRLSFGGLSRFQPCMVRSTTSGLLERAPFSASALVKA
jgi:hypothetical protein